MKKSFCRLLILVNHSSEVSRVLNMAYMPFNAIRENKIIMKISRFTVSPHCPAHNDFSIDKFPFGYICIIALMRQCRGGGRGVGWGIRGHIPWQKPIISLICERNKHLLPGNPPHRERSGSLV